MQRLALAIYRALHVAPLIRLWILRLVNTRFMVGAVALILDEHGDIVLFHHTYRVKYPWGLPGGWLKRGEQPAQALEREIAEESELKVRVMQPIAALSEGSAPMVELIFAAEILSGQFKPSDEVDRMESFAPDKLPENMTHRHAKVIQNYLAEQGAKN
jgi:8-oxo-dGTP diphosphatase